jgi:hypothetical protein
MKHGSNTQAYRDELEAYAQKFGIDISQVLERYQPSAVRLTVDTPVDTPAPAPTESFKFQGNVKLDNSGVSDFAESDFTEVADDSEPAPEPPPDADPDDLFADLKRKYDSRQDS